MKKNIFAIVTIGMLLLSSFLVSPVFSVSNVPNLELGTNIINEKETSNDPYGENIIWDNGMDYDTFIAAQWDEIYPFDAYPADDFQFDKDVEVNNVHWVGGYFGCDYASGPKDYNFSWNVSFYQDRGDGDAPGDLIAEYVMDEADVNREYLFNDSTSWYANYSITLPESISFNAYTKYWVSIIGIGEVSPQSGWGGNLTITMNQSVFKSEYFGCYDWTNSSDVFGDPYDMCFQLSYAAEQPNNPPNKPSDPDPIHEAENVSLNPNISVNVSDPDGDTMNVSFWGYRGSNEEPPELSNLVYIGTNTDVLSGTTSQITWNELDYNTTYYWYAIANDSEYINRSDTWKFTTMEETPNIPPVANFTHSINDLTVTFDASSSSDEDGTIENYTWDFGDGSTGYEVIVDHNYTSKDDEAIYTVKLTVTDNGSKTGTLSKQIGVVNNKPFANFSYAIEGKTVQFDASSSYDENGTIDSYYWDFGDGKNGGGVKPKHTYDEDYKTYNVTLTVNDSAGASSNLSKDVTIDDGTPPTVKILKPVEKGVYIRNDYKISRLIGMPLIIGDITIKINATDEGSGVKQVNITIDKFRPFAKQEVNITTPDDDGNYTWLWGKKVIFRFLHIHTIIVEVEDNAGNTATSDRMIVRRFL